MALFNKIFSSRKNPCIQDNSTSEKLFGFDKDQVRMVLFRECDFRGRKLLFDSMAIKREQVQFKDEINEQTTGIYAEISDGYGYMFIKPPPDSSNLSEMIFGLIAMSYRGSYFKILKLETPPRLMMIQVFPSPKYAQRKLSSSSHGRTSSQGLGHSIRLDDSGTSISDHLSLSVHSTNSDTILVCRRSCPLDVPQKFTESSSSAVLCDSGVYGRSLSSDGNRQVNVYCWDSLPMKVSFSNSTFYKKWLRSSSLDQSTISLNSAEDSTLGKFNQRSSKLGLAFIIQLTSGQEETQIQFLMEHIALLESMMWRARCAAELAYLRPNNFLSILLRMVNSTSDWLTNLLAGPLLPSNSWTSLCNKLNEISVNFNSNYDCDNNDNSITCEDCQKKELSFQYTNNSGSSSSSGEWFTSLRHDKSFSSITKILRNEWDSFNSKIFGNNDRNSVKIFIKDLCDLLENVDIKSTNFFISTLLTAVLTHHLGWVSTCLSSVDDGNQLNIDIPFNPLWGQLSDLYGAIGHPSRVAQTLIVGTKKKELITKIINCLTYFIRSCDLERNNFVRSNIYDDDKTADYICDKNLCIPKENFKQFSDHLREMLNSNTKKPKKYQIFAENLPESRSEETKFKLGLSRKSQINLCDLNEEDVDDSEFTSDSELKRKSSEQKVLFVLGDDDQLVNIKKSSEIEIPDFLDSVFKKYETFEEEFSKSNFKDEDFVKYQNKSDIKPSTSWASLHQTENYNYESEQLNDKHFIRSQSVPPKSKEKEIKEENKSKYRYAGIKFSLHQYPQVVTNYMRSKNYEMANLSFSDITKKFDQISTENDEIKINFSQYDNMNSDDMEALQTPSNASDLEFTNDLSIDLTKRDFRHVPNEHKSNVGTKNSEENLEMKIINFPMPKSEVMRKLDTFPYSTSLLRGSNEKYIPDLVLQGILAPKIQWEPSLKNDLALTSRNCFLNQRIEEAVAIIADTDNWEVQLVSSHTYVIDKTSSGVRVGMSQLIASMLDSLLKMWKLQVPAELCLLHIEQKLQALCVRSRALAQLLLATEFCSMEFVTSTLHLEVNDVPLLLAVASTYSPQVTQKYGISFQ